MPSNRHNTNAPNAPNAALGGTMRGATGAASGEEDEVVEEELMPHGEATAQLHGTMRPVVSAGKGGVGFTAGGLGGGGMPPRTGSAKGSLGERAGGGGGGGGGGGTMRAGGTLGGTRRASSEEYYEEYEDDFEEYQVYTR